MALVLATAERGVATAAALTSTPTYSPTSMFAFASATARAPTSESRADTNANLPSGAQSSRFENLDGAVIVSGMLRGANDRDTTGLFIVDTGAGFLALAPGLIQRLGLCDTLPPELTFAPRALRTLTIGGVEQQSVAPILCVNTKVIEQATDRDVLGLLGQGPLDAFAVSLDYVTNRIALIPMQRDAIKSSQPHGLSAADLAASSSATAMAKTASREALGRLITSSTIAIPFDLAGDGKIVVRARVGESAPSSNGPASPKGKTSSNGGGASVGDGSQELSLILDTGATKTVLFVDALGDRATTMKDWRQLKGLTAPTLYGTEEALVTRVPRFELRGENGSASAEGVDVALLKGELGPALAQATGQRIDGLLGYSFLRRFRVTIDYPHRILWLEPVNVPRDQRPNEYSHVGIQIERRDGALSVVAVAEDSPAARAGIQPGDELVSIDGTPAARLDVVGAARLLEGPPGSRTALVLKRSGKQKNYPLTRQRLL
jgi:hypothetical protein